MSIRSIMSQIQKCTQIVGPSSTNSTFQDFHVFLYVHQMKITIRDSLQYVIDRYEADSYSRYPKNEFNM